MDFPHFAPVSLIDAHVHFMHLEQMDSLLAVMETVPYARVNLLSFPNPGGESKSLRQAVNFNPEAITFKARYPDRAYISGGLDYTQVFADRPHAARLLAGQVSTLKAIGFDGLKLIEGKPQWRQWIPIPLDAPEYEEMWATLEELGMAVLCHFGDPGIWEKPYEGHSPDEMSHVLERYPNLNIAFAHFYFLADHLTRAGEFLDAHPNVCFDLSPGPVFGRPDAAREFFIQYQDRLLYGTDTLSTNLDTDKGMSWALARAWWLRNLLEADRISAPPAQFRHRIRHEVDESRGLNCRGLSLPREVLEKIYHANFERMYGPAPAPLDRETASVELDRMAPVMDAQVGLNGRVDHGVDIAALLQHTTQAKET